MKYIVYLTVNTKSKINGHERIYIGVHKTEDPDIFDGYIGCGVKIYLPSSYMYPKTPFLYAVKKYGVHAFKRTTLFIFDNEVDAYKKEHELVTEEFIKLDYTYNVAIGGIYEERYKPLYLFDLLGKLVKKWERSIDAYEFYGYPMERFDSPKRNKCIFLDSYWSTSPTINVEEYSKTYVNKTTYLYSKDGKLLREFSSLLECAKYLDYDRGELNRAIKNQTLILKSYYVSNTLVDEFIVKPRRNYMSQTFYVYDVSGKFIGEFKGKALMSVINLHSWNYISNIFTHNRGWYKDYYISLKPVDKVPLKRVGTGICVDIYTKYGEYIETLKSVKEVKEKYKVPAAKIKNILFGDKYFENYIFKYNNK